MLPTKPQANAWTFHDWILQALLNESQLSFSGTAFTYRNGKHLVHMDIHRYIGNMCMCEVLKWQIMTDQWKYKQNPPTHSFICWLTHSFIRWLTDSHSLTHIHSLTQSLTHPTTYPPPTHSLTHQTYYLSILTLNFILHSLTYLTHSISYLDLLFLKICHRNSEIVPIQFRGTSKILCVPTESGLYLWCIKGEYFIRYLHQGLGT